VKLAKKKCPDNKKKEIGTKIVEAKMIYIGYGLL
jgi:hypothetical protein